jgi:hypothetical protein
MSQVQESHFLAMKTFQGGIFIITVAGGERDIFVFEVLDEVDGEETFADTPLAIKDQIKAFGHIISPGGSCSTLAIRGPRGAKDGVSVGAVAGLLVDVAGVRSGRFDGATGGDTAKALLLSRGEARRLADDLRMNRSFKT